MKQLRLVLMSAILVWPGSTSGQEQVRLDRIRQCVGCSLVLNLEREFLLPRSLGPAADAQVRRSTANDVWAVFRTGGREVHLYGPRYQFLRTVAVAPASQAAAITDAHFLGADLVVADIASQRVTVLDTRGIIRVAAQPDIRLGRLRTVNESTIVVGSMDRRPAVVGYPLHSLILRPALGLNHFGSVDGQFSSLEAFSDDVVLGWADRGNTVWWAKRTPLHLEEWSLNGTQRRVIVGSLPWLSPAPRDTALPPAILQEFAVSNDRLVLVFKVPDARAQQVQRRGTERTVSESDYDRFFDIRLEAFDLRKRVHLGSAVFDASSAGLTMADGNVFLVRAGGSGNMSQVALFTISSAHAAKQEE